MTTISIRPTRNLATPLTLAAALLAMVLVGSILLSGGSRPSNSGVIGAAVATDTVTPTAVPPVIGVVSSLQAVNVREAPSTSSDAIRALNPGTKVEILGQNADGLWINIRMDDGQYGWIAASLVIMNSQPTLVAVITSTPNANPLAIGVNSDDCSAEAVQFRQEQLGNLQSQLTQLQTDYDATLAKGVTLIEAVDIAANQAELSNISGSLTNAQSLYDQLNQDVLLCQSTVLATDQEPAPDMTLTNIVIARQNLPIGFQFPDTADKLADYVMYAPWPVGALPFAALTENDNGMEALLGQTLRTDVFREQPIMESLLVDGPPAAISGVMTMLADRVAVSIPISALQPVEKSWYQVGDTVDVIAGMMIVDNTLLTGTGSIPIIGNQPTTPSATGTPPVPQLIMQRLIQNAQVISVGEVPANNADSSQTPLIPLLTPDATTILQTNPVDGSLIATVPPSDIITLAVTPEDAVVLQWALEAKLPLTLVHSPTVPSTYMPVVVARQFLPLGTRMKADMLTTIYWPVNLVPSGTFNDPAALVGQYLNAPIEAWQPVTSGSVSADALYVERFIPHGWVASEIDRKLITGMTAGLQRDDTVDISVYFLYTDWPVNSIPGPNTVSNANEDGQLVVKKVLLRGVRVYNMGHVRNVDGDEEAVSLLLTPEDASVLNWIMDSSKPFAITLTREGETVDLQVRGHLGDGRIGVDVPIQSTIRVSQVNGVDVTEYSNVVGVYANLTFDGFDNQGFPYVQYNLIPDAQWLNPDDTAQANFTATLFIKPEDLPVLELVLESGISLGLNIKPA